MAMCKVSSTVHFVTRSAGGRESSARAHWVPNTDVYTTDSGLVIKVELAGMRSDHLEITVEGSRLRIAGTRPDGCRSSKCSFLVMEINYGLSQAKAAYLNGFLRIDVPLVQRSSKSTTVPIAEGNQSLL
jgi:HSP20 family molecular chaperone IbpA